MYAIKSAWVGQTFALASSNDSGGKKSRIRRSKEERKTMIESFIKNYQKLNNGNFPSLNLTHKEVGGSFYTVREIVRDIIQENRVLGPAKLSKNYMSMEQLPLGSIAIEPQTGLSPSEERDIASPVTLNQYHTETEEDILSSNGQLNESELQSLLSDNGQVANDNNVPIEEVSDSEGSVGTQTISDDQVTNAEQLLITAEPFNIPNHQEVNNEESNAAVLGSAMPISQQEVSLEHHAETNKELHMHSGQESAGNGYLKSSDDEISQALGKPNEESDAAVLGSAMPVSQQEVSLEHHAETNKELHMHSGLESAGNGYLKSSDDEISQALGKPNEESDAAVLGSAKPVSQQEVSLEHHAETNKEPHMHSGQESAGNGYLKSSDDEISQALGKPNEESDAAVLGSAMPVSQQEISLEHHAETNKEPHMHSGQESAGNGYLKSSDDEISQALAKPNERGESIYGREVAEDNLDSAVVQTSDPKLSNGKAGLKTDVFVEKFPLRPVSRTIHDFEVAISEQCDRPKTSAAAAGTDSDITSSSNSVNVEDVAVLSVGDSPPESLKSTSKETLEAQTSPLVGEKPVNDTERMSIEKKINTRNSGVGYGQQRPIREENNASKSQLRNQHDSSKKTGRSSTLNRPNLEMWEGGSSVKQPAGRESNPLLALLKEFIKAFEKFFTE